MFHFCMSGQSVFEVCHCDSVVMSSDGHMLDIHDTPLTLHFHKQGTILSHDRAVLSYFALWFLCHIATYSPFHH